MAGRLGSLWLASCCLAATPGLAQTDGHGAPDAGADHAVRHARRLASCAALASLPFPRTPIERRSLLQRYEAAREACIDHAPLLAALGGTWLEEGDPDQALLWLERSLLLDPEQPAAQADHALALMALGNPSARDELLRRWADRRDVPPLVWARLQRGTELVARSAAAGTPPTSPRWAQYREAGWLLGYESNLDHSPRLNELTITPPDGPLSLPLAEAIQPRAGAAVMADLAWQFAYSPRQGTVFQAGLQGTARHAFDNTDTDWHHLQVAVGASQRLGSWRAQVQASAARLGGRLNEPYAGYRLGLSLENNGVGCAQRIAADAEDRRQKVTASNDGRTTALQWSLTCPLPGAPAWTGGIAARLGVDRPFDELRPGGEQRQASLGWRLSGPVWDRWRLEASLRLSRNQDLQGYSPLLESNARRDTWPLQASVELSRPLSQPLLQAADAVVQLQHTRQRSNLALFRYSATSLYTGLRWKW